jgi:hypothetical protein
MALPEPELGENGAKPGGGEEEEVFQLLAELGG